MWVVSNKNYWLQGMFNFPYILAILPLTVSCSLYDLISLISLWRCTCVDRREARVISKLPFNPSSDGTRMKISETSVNTDQCWKLNNHYSQVYTNIEYEITVDYHLQQNCKLEAQGPCTGHRSIIAILYCFSFKYMKREKGRDLTQYTNLCGLNTLPH